MPTLMDLLAQLGPGQGGLRPGSVGAQQQQLQAQLGRQAKLALPADFGARQGYAPSGPLINFTGGLPFKPNETPAIVQNGAILLQELLKARGGGGASVPPGYTPGNQGQIPEGFGGSAEGDDSGRSSGAFTPAPSTNAKSGAARSGSIGSYIDELFAMKGEQAAMNAQMEARQQAAAARLQLGLTDAENQRKMETDQAYYDEDLRAKEQQRKDAEKQAAADAKAAGQPAPGPFQVEIPSDSPMAQRPVAFDKPLSQLPAGLDAAMGQLGNGAMGGQLQQGAQAASPANNPQVPQSLQGLPVNTGPTSVTTQQGVRGEVIDEGPFGVNAIGVPSFSQQIAPNELGPADIAAARQGEAAAAAAAAQQKAKQADEQRKLYATTLKDLTSEYGSTAPASDLNALAKAIAFGDDETAAAIAKRLPKAEGRRTPGQPGGTGDSILDRQLTVLRAKEAEKDRDGANTQLTTLQSAESAFQKAITLLEDQIDEKTGKVKKKARVNTDAPFGAASVEMARFADREGVSAVERAFGEELTTEIQRLRGLGPASDRDLEAIAKTTGGFGKGNKQNLETLRQRLQKTQDLIKRLSSDRDRAENDLNTIYKTGAPGAKIQAIPRTGGGSGERTEVSRKTQRNSRTGATRTVVTYSDGTTEIVNGGN